MLVRSRERVNDVASALKNSIETLSPAVFCVMCWQRGQAACLVPAALIRYSRICYAAPAWK
jgi:hypothetical protein